MRILIVSSESLPGSEERNLDLAEELIRRGHSVRHAGPAQGLIGFHSTAYGPEFPELPRAKACRTELFAAWSRLRRLVAWSQVVVFSVAKGYQDIADYAAQMSKVIVYLADTSLHPWLWRADLVCAGSPYERDRLASLTGLDEMPRLKVEHWARLSPLEELSEEDIPVTGTTLHDQAAPANRRLDRAAFLERYGLDPEKRTAVWLPSSPACHDDWFKGLYRRVCGAVEEEAGFNLIIKPHPRDYAGAKQGARYEDTVTPTWEQLAPGVRVCRPEDKWDCFREADVLLSSWTTAAIEAGLVRTPMLLVDRLSFGLEIIGRPDPALKELLPRTRYQSPSLRTLGVMEPLVRALARRVDPETREYLENCLASETDFYRIGFPEYLGTDCTMAELPRVLAEGLYRLDDRRAFDAYESRYSAGLDGRAYLRIADAVESVEKRPRTAAKLRAQNSFSRRYMVPLNHSRKEFSQKVRNRLAASLGQRG